MARILVIDDQPQIRDNCREALEEAGHTIMVAVDGQEGVQLYHREPVDLVLLDLYMPKLDGLATIQALRVATCPGQKLHLLVWPELASPRPPLIR